MKRLIGIFILSAALLLVTTCSEPIDFVNEVETEVKIANDLFLVIESIISPEENSTSANPGSQIIIQFDRDIKITSVTDSTLIISNLTDNTEVTLKNPVFNSLNKRLIIEPFETGYDGYFKDNTDYLIRISGVEGSDGSSLQKDYSWTFTTGVAPAGTILVSDGGLSSGADADTGFTNELTVTVNIATKNVMADEYHVSPYENDLSDPLSISVWADVNDPFSVSIPDSSDGIKFLYAIFVDNSGTVFSRPISGTIYLDRTNPIVQVGDNVISNSGITKTGSYSEAFPKDNTVLWQGTGLSFSEPTSLTTTINEPASDGDYTVTLAVRDKAGNTGTDSFIYTVDNFPPNPPDVTAETSSPTYDTTPLFSWTSGGGDGNGRYYCYCRMYSYENGISTYAYPGYTYSNSLSIPTVSISGIDRVRAYLYVREYDEAGNYSSYGNDSVIVSRYLPYNTQTGVSRYPTIYWPTVKGATGYALQTEDGFGVWHTVYSGTKNSFVVSSSNIGPLPSGGSITWRVATTFLRGLPQYSDELVFTTE